MDALDGITIKGYELRERIGSGGFGVVYRAFQSTVGREVAVKVILPGFSNHPEFIRRFEGEARMIARLEHLHIVPLYDYWRDPEGAYLVMRLMRGGNMRNLLNKGPLDLEAVAQILDQVTSALAVAHRVEIIHRDIKPANILLDEDNNAYLSDFGIAKDLRRLGSAMTAPDGLVGSPDYLSPEQARSERVSPQTDIYSLGVVLYEMLVGEHPFPGLSPVEQLFKHINEDLPVITNLDSAVNDDINAVVQKATAKNPNKRYEDVLALALAFREAAALSISQVAESLVELLTPREQEVLKCIIDGKTNREIAKLLTVELPTVKWYVRQLYRKLNVRSRVQAIVRARELNLIMEKPGKRGGVTTRISRLPEPENPYKGLRAFQIADEQDFFGRDRLKGKLIERLCEKGEYTHFLAIVGPSGSGKSSLVKAGLIPALWRGELPGSEKWYIVDMVPGGRPIDELEVALTRITADHTINIGEHLRRDAYGLQRVAKLILPNDNSELLLVIDQFEEVFTLVPEEEARTHFLDLLYAAVTDPRGRVRLIVTLRADFYDRPLHYPGFGELVRERMETVLPLSAEELEQAIARPSMRVGVRFEEGLVARIIDEMLYQPGALPLMQYALTELFEARTNRKLTLEGYEAIGGAVGALAKRAEEIYAELEPVGHECVQQMFLRLITLGEGTEDTRRRVPRSELLSIADEPDRMDEIIDTYAAYRLLSLDNDPGTRTPTVEVAHEAILREWERLGEWLIAARDDIRLQRQLAQAAEDWHAAGQEESYLLRGARLSQFESWAAETKLALTPGERAYLQECVALREREETEEAARKAHEVALEKRARGVLQALVAVFLAAAILAAGLAIYASLQRQDALRQASIGLAAQSMIELEGAAPERAVLLALEALENYPYTPQVEAALGKAVLESRPYITIVDGGAVYYTEVSWSPDGRAVATSSTTVIGNVFSIWETRTAREIQHVSVDIHDVCWTNMVEWSPNGDRLLVSRAADPIYTGCNAVEVWDTSNATLLLKIEFPQETPPLGVAWSPDGRTILVAIDDGTVRILEAESLREIRRLQVAEGGYYLDVGNSGALGINVAWSPTGRAYVTVAWDGSARVWDAQTDTEILTLSGHTGGLTSVTWSPDGEHIATASADGTARIWDAVTGEPLFNLSGHMGLVGDVAWSPDGRRIATAGADKTVHLWSAATGESLQIFHFGYRVWSLDWSPDSQYLALRGEEVRILDLSQEPLRLVGHTKHVWGARYSPDGRRIATLSGDGSARIWDSTTGQELLRIEAHSQGGCYLAWSPDGKRIVTTGMDGPGRVWDAHNGEMLFQLTPTYEGNLYCGVGWSADGSKIGASSVLDYLAVIFDANSGEILSKVGAGDCFLFQPTWSPDSNRFTTGCAFVDGVTPLYIWDDESGELIMALEGLGGNSWLAKYSPDEKRIAVASYGGTVMLFEADSGELQLTFAGHTDAVHSVTWSPDGKRVASGDAAGEVKIWEADSGAVVLSYQLPSQITQLDWSLDGKSLLATGYFNTPVVMPVWTSTEALIEHAYECCVPRQLTPEERALFGLPER